MFFQRKKPTAPDMPAIDTAPVEEALAEADRELRAAQNQAVPAKLTAHTSRQTHLRNHFAPAFEAQFRPKGIG